MKKHIHTLCAVYTIIFIISGCMTVREPYQFPKTKVSKTDEQDMSNAYFDEHPVLHTIYETHEIHKLPESAGDKFVTLYLLTLKKEYLPKGNRTFCTKFFYDYFTSIGYSELIDNIKKTKGKNMVEKAMNYADETGEILVLLFGYEAQKLANKGRDVGVLGEYYYDKAQKKYTIHYSVVQPSNIAFDEEGNMVPYWVTGLITKRKSANNRYGTGTFLAQAGIANGLIDFRWAYNTKLNGIIQKDSKGNFRGGIIFIVFPEKKQPVLGFADLPVYYLTVNTEPADSSVYVDGVYRGKGSDTILLLRKGERTITATYPGYKEKQKVVTLAEKKNTTLKLKLELITGSIHVTTTPEKANIIINGKKAGVSPCLISDLPPGEYTVNIQLPGYVSVSTSITVKQDIQTEVNSVLEKYEMIKISGGTFRQGGPGPGSVPVHPVRVDDFYISKYEVTGEQYESFCIETGKPWPGTQEMGYRSKPVTGVTWYDAVEYCNWLSKKQGYTSYYDIRKNEAAPDSVKENDKNNWIITYNKDANGYRLPAEAEWEFAAKGGSLGKGFMFAGSDKPDSVAWYNSNSGKKIHTVGQLKPNECGIYDMSGNVWEWCNDWYDELYYEQAPEENPPGPAAGTYRVRRGGSVFNGGDENRYLTTSSRGYREPHRGNADTGFRVVRQVDV